MKGTCAAGRADDEIPDGAKQVVRRKRRQRRCEHLQRQKQASVVYPQHRLPRSKQYVTPRGSPGFQSGRDLPSDKAAVKFTAGSEEKARPLRAQQAPSKWSTCPSMSVAMSTAAKAQGLTVCSGFQSVVHEKSRRPSPREDSGRVEPERERPKCRAEPAGGDVAFTLTPAPWQG